MSNKYKVGILGASGAVGREMIKILEERSFPVSELKLLASENSAGKTFLFKGEEITIEKANDNMFSGLDLVLGAAGNEVAKKYAPLIKRAGAVFIDNSSAFRLKPDVPLVIPEINPQDALKHNGIISNPNCTTIITLVALSAIAKESEIISINASSYQAASGAGAGGPIELLNETAANINEKEYLPKVFAYQLAFNVIPAIGKAECDGYTSEEMKMQNEGRKILGLPSLKATCTCVRVPVYRSHSVSVTVRTKDKITADRAKELISQAPGCRLYDDLENGVYPMPLLTSDQDLVYAGRIREDLTCDNGIVIWCCGDQIRKGAATNAVQIAELLI